MEAILSSYYQYLHREVRVAATEAVNKGVPAEAAPFKAWLMSFYAHFVQELDRWYYYVQLKDPDLYPELLKNYATYQWELHFVNSRFLPSLSRSSEKDAFCLKIIGWLHSQHPQTQQKSFAVADGEFAILPVRDYPLLYQIPVTAQHNLLNIPLIFHEKGHYLYAYHKEEMDALVQEFQAKLEDHLMIPFQQNDERTQRDREKSKVIIETWFEWMQELFCDAVGLTIGGAGYLYAFFHYVRGSGRSAFHISERDLARLSHPVTWLRIHFLLLRATDLGLTSEAKALEKEWIHTAKTLQIKEEYYGYYTWDYQPDIIQTLEDMLIEANPIQFSEYENGDNCISWCINAWQKYIASPNTYPSWEVEAIQNIVKKYQTQTKESN